MITSLEYQQSQELILRLIQPLNSSLHRLMDSLLRTQVFLIRLMTLYSSITQVQTGSELLPLLSRSRAETLLHIQRKSLMTSHTVKSPLLQTMNLSHKTKLLLTVELLLIILTSVTICQLLLVLRLLQ